MTSSQPLVSIIVPAYNAERFLAETLESVLAQTYPHWELLLTDDGSTDGTFEVAQDFARRDARIRGIRLPENTGLAAAARNHSLEQSKGDLIAFLDADDVWLPEKLEKQVAHLQANPECGAVCCWYDVFGDPARVAEWNGMLWRPRGATVTPDEVLIQSLTTPTVMLRRACYEALGPMPARSGLRIGEDWMYFTELVFRFRVDRLCEPLLRVRLHPVNASLSTAGAQNRGEAEQLLAIRLLREKGVLDDRWYARALGITYYRHGKDRLFHSRESFRRPLWKSLGTGAAPPRALVMLALSWLPRPALVWTLKALMRAASPGSGWPQESSGGSRESGR